MPIILLRRRRERRVVSGQLPLLTLLLALSLLLQACGSTELPSPAPSETPEPTATSTATPPPPATPSPVPTATRAPFPIRGEVSRGDAQTPEVALTFDCGSASGPTAAILEILRQNNLKVTFFVTGAYADRYPALVKQMVDAGHELANHSYSHPDLRELTDQQIRSEMQRTEEALMRAAGRNGKPWMRMPFGGRDNRVLGIINQLGYTSVFWTLDSGDWLEGATKASVEQKVLSNMGNGYIVVEHCNAESSAQALPAILQGLKAKGLRVVTVSILLGVSSPPVASTDLFLAPVSKSYGLASDYVPPDLVVVTEVPTGRAGLRVRSAVLQPLKTMLDEAERQGLHIYAISTYRSYQEQATLFQQYVNQMGEAEASRVSARPGHSEHQLGAAIDFTSPKVNYDLLESFGQLPEGRWLQENAPRFGFVMSYPEGKESITGYAYEPWHFRYVGVDVAAAVLKSGQTLSEYLAGRG